MHENYKVINHYTGCLHNTHSAIDFLVVLISVHSKWAKTPSLLNQFSGLWGQNNTIMCTPCLYIILHVILRYQSQVIHLQIHCGPGLWHRLVYLNMSDPS